MLETRPIDPDPQKTFRQSCNAWIRLKNLFISCDFHVKILLVFRWPSSRTETQDYELLIPPNPFWMISDDFIHKCSSNHVAYYTLL